MKIGILHYSLPPTIGGVERVIAAHERLFRENGHEVVLLTPEGSRGEAEADSLSHLILQLQLDVLLVHNLFTMPFCMDATVCCHSLAADGLPIVSWIHDLAATNPAYQVDHDSLLRQHPAGVQVVCVSQERAEAYGLLTGFTDIRIIPNGIDTLGESGGTFLRDRPELAHPMRNAYPILFHPTRILQRKNIALGIRVIAALKSQGLRPRLLISGAPEPFSGSQSSHRSELDNLIRSLQVEKEVFFLSDLTPLNDFDIAALYQISDALFFPSEHEGFGLPILEAGLRGLPIFASETQPLAHLVRQNGLTFPLDLPPFELACQILHFLAHHPAACIRQTVRRDFDWHTIYSRHILPLLETFHR